MHAAQKNFAFLIVMSSIIRTVPAPRKNQSFGSPIKKKRSREIYGNAFAKEKPRERDYFFFFPVDLKSFFTVATA